MSDLREQIANALAGALAYAAADGSTNSGYLSYGNLADAVMAKVQPALDAKDADRERLYGMVQAVTERNMEMLQRAEKAETILRDLVDAAPYWFDHDGFCQAHGYGAQCARARARDHLTALAQPDDQPKET